MKTIQFFLLFILPFLYMPFFFLNIETPKVFAAELSIELFFLLYLTKQVTFKTLLSRLTSLKTYTKNPQVIFLMIIFLLSIFHLIFLNSSYSFFGNIFRLQGIFLLWHLLLYALLSSQIKSNESGIKIYFFLNLLLFIAAIVLGTTFDGRSIGTIGEPNAFATTIIFFFPFLLYSLFKKGKRFKKTLIFLTFIMTLLTLFLTGSRAGLIAFFVESCFITLTFILKKKFSLTVVLGVILMICALSLPFFEHYKFENRTTIWQIAAVAGLKSPLIGNGFGNTQIVMKEAAIQLKNKYHGVVIDSAHNMYLDWWVQGGVVGLFSLLSLIVFTIKNFTLYKSKLEITLLLGVITALSFNPASVVNLVEFWWLIGLGISGKSIFSFAESKAKSKRAARK